MRIVLSTSPHVRHPAVLTSDFQASDDLMYGFAPVGLLSLIATMRDSPEHEPMLFDLNRAVNGGRAKIGPDLYSDIADLIVEMKPDIVGFMTECDSYHHVLQIVDLIHARRRCAVILGGPHATAVAETTLRRRASIDAIVLGEGERSFVDLVEALQEGFEGPVPGVLRRNKQGEIISAKPAALIEDLDLLPVPAYEIYTPDDGEEIFLEVGRGCPFQCSFCSTAPFWQRRHRVKSPQRIIREIELITGLYGNRRLHFTHDLFTADRRWVQAVCQALINAGSPVRWTCSARTDLVDSELLQAMARAGCDAIYFGLESGSPEVLAAINKNIAPERNLKVLALCRESGIRPNAGFILGFPQDDQKSAQQTFSAFTDALSLGTSPTHIFGYCPFVASSMFGGLGELRFTGHYLDIPLGDNLDLRNRDLIKSDPSLFASYGRPAKSGLWSIAPGFMEGIDEFSPLVEAALLPALALASVDPEGMYGVYRRWLDWISAHNERRGAAPWRRWYGSPADFCQFLVDLLEASPNALRGAADLAAALEVSFRVTQGESHAGITMATYRSARKPVPLSLDSELFLTDVIAARLFDHNIVEALQWRAGSGFPNMEPNAVCLVWRIGGDGVVKLLSAPPTLYPLIRDLQCGPLTVGALIKRWSMDPRWSHQAHVKAVEDQVHLAIQSGLVGNHV